MLILSAEHYEACFIEKFLTNILQLSDVTWWFNFKFNFLGFIPLQFQTHTDFNLSPNEEFQTYFWVTTTDHEFWRINNFSTILSASEKFLKKWNWKRESFNEL